MSARKERWSQQIPDQARPLRRSFSPSVNANPGRANMSTRSNTQALNPKHSTNPHLHEHAFRASLPGHEQRAEVLLLLRAGRQPPPVRIVPRAQRLDQQHGCTAHKSNSAPNHQHFLHPRQGSVCMYAIWDTMCMMELVQLDEPAASCVHRSMRSAPGSSSTAAPRITVSQHEAPFMRCIGVMALCAVRNPGILSVWLLVVQLAEPAALCAFFVRVCAACSPKRMPCRASMTGWLAEALGAAWSRATWRTESHPSILSLASAQASKARNVAKAPALHSLQSHTASAV